MEPLTKAEIQFIKETGWTPTVQQADEWRRTIFVKDFLPKKLSTDGRIKEKSKNDEEAFNSAIKYADEKYNINLIDLYDKCTHAYDITTLEHDAAYLFYVFFTKEELKKLTDEEATSWLKDFKYYCGYRKWDGDNLLYVDEAISVYDGQAAFYLDKDNTVWWFDGHPSPSSYYTKYEVENND